MKDSPLCSFLPRALLQAKATHLQTNPVQRFKRRNAEVEATASNLTQLKLATVRSPYCLLYVSPISGPFSFERLVYATSNSPQGEHVCAAVPACSRSLCVCVLRYGRPRLRNRG